jgi:transcriptional regulator with XRE-family HTH domain
VSTDPRLLAIDWKAVGRRVRELRGFDCKQSELAEAIGVAQSHISTIERGLKEPSATILLKIATYYGKSLDWLVTGIEPKS